MTAAALLMLVPVGIVRADFALGVRAGLNLATVCGDVDDEYLGMNAGPAVSADVALRPREWVGIRSGIGYAARGARWSYEREDDDGAQSRAEDDSRVHYLDIPLLLELSMPRGWRVIPSVYAGATTSFFLGAHKTVAVDGTIAYQDDKNANARNLDLGITMGGGATTAVGPGHLLFDIGYTFGLLSVDGSGDEWVKNRTLSLRLGYAFVVGNREE